MPHYTKTLIEKNYVKGGSQVNIVDTNGKEIVIQSGVKVTLESNDGNYVNIDVNGIKLRTYSRNIVSR